MSNIGYLIKDYRPDIEMEGNGNYDLGHKLAEAICNNRVQRKNPVRNFLVKENQVRKKTELSHNTFHTDELSQKELVDYYCNKILLGIEEKLL